MNKSAAASTSAPVRIRSVALPAEHGGWGFLLEPILLGLLVTPSLAGLFLGIASFSLFLLHQPMRTALKDRAKGKRYMRTLLAERIALLYASILIGSFVLAWITAAHPFWQPLIGLLALASVQMVYEFSNRGRELIPEVAGALALGGIAPAMALAAGWSMEAALPLWVILGVRSLVSVAYVRSRLRLEKGKPASQGIAVGVHVIGVLLLALLAAADIVPWLSVVAGLVLLARAAHGLSRLRRPTQAIVIGFLEMAYGLITVLLVAAGYRLGI
jgi:hypothetical protein